MRQYLADQRFAKLGMSRKQHANNLFRFIDLHDVQEVADFPERRVSTYQVGVQGEAAFETTF